MLLTAASSCMFCSESSRRMRQADTAPATDRPMSAPTTAASAIDSVFADIEKASIALHERESEDEAERAGEGDDAPVAVFAQLPQHSRQGSRFRRHTDNSS